MRRVLQGEARASFALGLALLATGGIVGSGCQRAAEPPVPLHYVQIESLVRLHPAWAQIESFDRIVAGMGVQPAALRLESPSLPTPFTLSMSSAENLSKERERRIAEDTQRYVNQLGEVLRTRNAQELKRRVRFEQKKADQEFREAIASEESKQRAEADRKRKSLDWEIYRLGFTRVAYQSQVRVTTGNTRDQALMKLQEVSQRIAALTAQRDSLPTDFRTLALQKVGNLRDTLNRRVENFESNLRGELQRRLEAQIASKNRELDPQAQEITALGAGLPDLPSGAPLPLPEAPNAQAVSDRGQENVQAALARQRTIWTGQRDRLLAQIRTDTEKSVLALSQREGWKLVSPGTRGASDATEAAATALRAQWQINSTR